jgi:ferrous iron transport protein B
MSCHSGSNSKRKASNGKNGKYLTFALAGNANVGKSVIFNQLTGSNQIIGNWPGKTVDRAEGTLSFEGYEIKVVDLPGIYSFSTFSMEELVSRDYVALEKPDAVINVVDASVLERNLFFTLQLLEMQAPLVLCINQIDVAKNKGILIDKEKLQEKLGIPVVFAVATRGEGIYELMGEAVNVALSKPKSKHLKYRRDLEAKIEKLGQIIEKSNISLQYPPRWLAIKLLEGDAEIVKIVSDLAKAIVDSAFTISKEISDSCQEACFSVIASERYALASSIAASTLQQSEVKSTFSEKLDWLTTHRVLGYFTSVGVIAGLLLWTFFIGNGLSNLISSGLNFIKPVDPALSVSQPILAIILNGVWGGFNAGLTLIIPYVITFYLLLDLVENS